MTTRAPMRLEKPFRGWPKTVRIPGEEGKPSGYRITADYLTPGLAKVPPGLGLATAIMTMQFLGDVTGAPGPWWEYPYIWVGSSIGMGLLAWRMFIWVLSRRAVIELWPDVIRIKGFRGFRNYTRGVQHQFRLEKHERAIDEEVDVQLKRQKGIAAIGRYYMNAAHVLLDHAHEGSITLATVWPMKKAQALCMRLQNIEQGWDHGEIE